MIGIINRLAWLTNLKASSILLTFGAKKVECPICHWQGTSFVSFGVTKRPNAMCPNCMSLERHRLLFTYFTKTLSKTKKIKLLHFAPERSLEQMFRSYSNIDYLSVDIEPGAAMEVEDITKLSFKDKTFDLICCSHILEHIVDDHQAMKELKRVLKPGGTAILQVPIADQEKTFEDFSITDERGREKIFGQKDHVRVYGRDYVHRLVKAGFKVNQVDFEKSIGPTLTKKYALLPRNGRGAPTEGIIYACH